LAAEGLGLRDVQALMGHRHSKTTDRYMHPSPTYQEAARRALDRRKVGSEVGSARKKSGRGKKRK
jgi:site-specific recombinase XerD